MKRRVILFVVALILMLGIFVSKVIKTNNFENVQTEISNNEQVDMVTPTLDLNGKKAEEYTWEEYKEMKPEEQMIFPDYFESFKEYEEWYSSVCPKE